MEQLLILYVFISLQFAEKFYQIKECPSRIFNLKSTETCGLQIEIIGLLSFQSVFLLFLSLYSSKTPVLYLIPMKKVDTFIVSFLILQERLSALPLPTLYNFAYRFVTKSLLC